MGNQEDFSNETSSYVLRSVLDDIPLSNHGADAAYITCVEYWNNNLYIGSSAAEILHFVSLPSNDDDGQSEPIYILASRLQPSGHDSPLPAAQQMSGIRQILVLPGPSKACVLCHGVVSFYSLPELSPVFPNKEPSGVQWIGGIDEDEGLATPEGPVVMIANSKRILRVRVGEKLRPVRTNIEFPGCLTSRRRGTVACVADKNAYSLLEVEHQQKIPLFPISSVDDGAEGANAGLANNTPAETLSTQVSPPLGHARSSSLGTFLKPSTNRSPSPQPQDLTSRNLGLPDPSHKDPTNSSDQARDRGLSATDTPILRPRSSTDGILSVTDLQVADHRSKKLKPLILSPSSTEFLLTTGSGENDPGVGMFVNLDGDVVRGTIEFERYPEALCIEYAAGSAMPFTATSSRGQDDTIFALIRKSARNSQIIGIESQLLSTDPVIVAKSKRWLEIPPQSSSEQVKAGLYRPLSPQSHSFPSVGHLLQLIRFRPTLHTNSSSQVSITTDLQETTDVLRSEEEKTLSTQPTEDNSFSIAERDRRRTNDEVEFARRLGHTWSQTLAFAGSKLWHVVENPEILQLESSLWLGSSLESELSEPFNTLAVHSTLDRIKAREAQTEMEFLTLNYIRQKASLMLLIDLLQDLGKKVSLDEKLHTVEGVLLEGAVDPRLVLLLLPELRSEVRLGSRGMWLHQGLADLLRARQVVIQSMADSQIDFWLMLRRYLSTWQDKRGYASITDEEYVFDSVDMALLRVLLHLDVRLPVGSGAQLSTRAKLNNVIDHWKGDFERAVTLLEEYHRLFVLSRLYQSRKFAKDVLHTWRRIGEGENDAGGELSSASVESRVRQYLVNIRDTTLVKDYSLWLAARNPDLAVQLLTDDAARVKFSPEEVTPMLKTQAPGAVQMYLEHLVFNKSLEQYADDLIGYYLDSVLSILEHSEGARAALSDSYLTYRALEKPKPTYLDFITQNAPQDAWWHSRLRLLQLLGSGSYAKSSSSKDLAYSIPMVLDRLAPFSSFLVSESIILDARQGRHKEALRLLIHGLGDYDTATRYCYFGGPSIGSSQPIDAGLLPAKSVQRELFAVLFEEFLLIAAPEEVIERTSELIGKFAAWFDPIQIFTSLPETWTVDLVAEFFLRTFRAATSQYNEAIIMKALSAAQNLQEQVKFAQACEKVGMLLEEVTLHDRDLGSSTEAAP